MRLLSGKRATRASLEKWIPTFRGASNEQINETLDALISPFHVDMTSRQFGIFIGGTGMHIGALGNIERLYNLYRGSKFYYGGLGNKVEFSDILSGGAGLGWTAVLDRAVADLNTFRQSHQKIHIFGFSRGAAMANDLAARLARHGVLVDFLGMFDPVYSRGFPGQDSSLVDSTYPGYFGNYVVAQLTSNVRSAAVIYAIHEDRSFFPATKFELDGSSEIITLMSPGVHSDIGGHFENNMFIQQLNLKAMIEFARGHGNVQFRYRGIEPDIARIIGSPASLRIQASGSDANAVGKVSAFWRESIKTEHWSPFTTSEYLEQLESRSVYGRWKPGGFGVQKGDWASRGAGAVRFALRLPMAVSYLWDPPQPFTGHYRRDLHWVERELWNLGLRDASDNHMRIPEESQEFIRSLYGKTVDALNGGWARDE